MALSGIIGDRWVSVLEAKKATQISFRTSGNHATFSKSAASVHQKTCRALLICVGKSVWLDLRISGDTDWFWIWFYSMDSLWIQWIHFGFTMDSLWIHFGFNGFSLDSVWDSVWDSMDSVSDLQIHKYMSLAHDYTANIWIPSAPMPRSSYSHASHLLSWWQQ